MKKSPGRMINADIARSRKVAQLSPESLALFCLLIPHFNSHGKMLANPHLIKGLVCPYVPWLTAENIRVYLLEITDKTNVKYWEDSSGEYLQSLNWKAHQDLAEYKKGVDLFPAYPGSDQSEVSKHSEESIETIIFDHLSLPGANLFNSEVLTIQRQLRINNCYIDIFCQLGDETAVIIEIKRGRLSDSTVEQILGYEKMLNRACRKIIIGQGYSVKLNPTRCKELGISMVSFDENLQFSASHPDVNLCYLTSLDGSLTS